MAINTNTPPQSFTATAGQTDFIFNFKVFATSDVIVYKTLSGNDPNDANDILTEGIDYSVTIDGDNGGTVVLNVGAGLDDKITVSRTLPVTRTVEYQQGGDILAGTSNDDQDYQTYLVQQNTADLQRTLKLGDTVENVDITLPQPLPDAYFKWNDDGTAIENDDTIPQNVSDAIDANLEAQSWANEAEDVPVKEYTNGVPENRVPTVFSAKHNNIKSQQAWDDFQSRYYGAASSDPTQDPLGNAPTEGDLYFNTTINQTRVYAGVSTGWQNAGSSVNGLATQEERIATEGQTLFTGFEYDLGFVLVYRNGYQLTTSDYTADDGETVTLNSPTFAGDNINVISFGAFTPGGLDDIVADIEQNQQDIATNSANIATNTANISQNTTAIESNDTDIEALDMRVTDLESGGTSVDRILFNPQVTAPTYQESAIFYDDATKSLSVFTDIPDFTHNLGQESVIRFINKTGATILNGQALRQDGVDFATSTPRVALAQANTLDNARVLGVATHDVPNDGFGFATAFGLVNDVDTSSFLVGEPLFLSETVPGGLTQTAPDIASRVAGTVVQDGSVGRIFVKPSNLMTFPTEEGYLQGQTSPIYDLNGTPQNITNYAIEFNVITSVDPVTGIISISDAGVYEFNLTLNGVADDEEEKIFFEFYDTTNNQVLWTYVKETGRSSTPSAVAFDLSVVIPLNILANNTDMVMRAYTDGTAVELQIDSINFSAKSLNIR